MALGSTIKNFKPIDVSVLKSSYLFETVYIMVRCFFPLRVHSHTIVMLNLYQNSSENTVGKGQFAVTECSGVCTEEFLHWRGSWNSK